MKKAAVKSAALVIDLLVFLFVIPAAILLKMIRRVGTHRMKLSGMILKRIGVFPIRNHYYEPQFVYSDDLNPDERILSGLNLCVDDQITFISQLTYTSEIVDWPNESPDEGEYHLSNKTFASGDAEFFYQMVRFLKPRRLYEIGSGYSTLIAEKAILKNKTENPDYECRHVCIEPYEMSWLENKGVEVIRKCVEDMNPDFFSDLGENDILFIDSSHIIRPKGDVLFIFLTLLPLLNKGVIVHVHDIFTPRNYLSRWLKEDVLFWNEQYLLEAFLSENHHWKVIAALNYLHHEHSEKLAALCPYMTHEREPGSFYIKKIG